MPRDGHRQRAGFAGTARHRADEQVPPAADLLRDGPMTAAELAAATGKTPAAIRQRLKRLVDRLREDLSDG